MSKLSRDFDAYGRSLTGEPKVTNTVQQSSGGLGFGGALFLVFLVLKLTHVINWSWWWVTAPLWIPTALVVFFLIVGLSIAVIVAIARK